MPALINCAWQELTEPCIPAAVPLRAGLPTSLWATSFPDEPELAPPEAAPRPRPRQHAGDWPRSMSITSALCCDGCHPDA